MILILLLILVGIIVGASIWLAILIRCHPEPPAISVSTAWIQLLQLFLALVATLAAGLGAYYTFFTPFKPAVEIGPYTWRIRPTASPNPAIELGLWFSARNEGAQTGSVTDFVAKVQLPRGEWFLQPVFFVDSEKYLTSLSAPNDSPELPVTEPFAPIILKGNSQVAKTLLFLSFEGKVDRNLLDPGVYFVKFYVQYSGEKSFHEIAARKIVIEKDAIERWRKGQTIAGAQLERPTDPRKLIQQLVK